jgi:hypothetical protein
MGKRGMLVVVPVDRGRGRESSWWRIGVYLWEAGKA